ncbi:MAG: hypothetical protein MRJ65_06465 [Candidatus Brocadiaceae bacterium]|nr:hypothetical protein [Candidatus Brocadiaceae bacterium]
MNFSGWLFLIFSWGIVTALVTFCYKKILSSGSAREDRKHHDERAGFD